MLAQVFPASIVLERGITLTTDDDFRSEDREQASSDLVNPNYSIPIH